MDANKMVRRTAVGVAGVAMLAVVLGLGAPVHETSESAQTLTWTADVQHWYAGSWDGGMQAAANHVEGGFDDWRLPTEAELKAALQDGSWGQHPSPGSTNFTHWTSHSQGIWAYAEKVVLDANGYPIPAQSGTSKKYLKTSNLYGAKFVRP